MLRHTFRHLPGVGEKTERKMWAAGLTTWDVVLAQEQPARKRGRALPGDVLRESQQRYQRVDLAWFGERLPTADSWRLFGDFRKSCAYLDIETTGMEDYDEITCVAVFAPGDTGIRTYVRGQNLGDFSKDIQAYPLLVTYNGKLFDLPFLRRCLGCRLDQAHIDLRHTLAALGFRGGLKSCERQLGVERQGLEDVDGMAAVLLWREFQRRKSVHALETLLAYNVQDAVNLETLMVEAFNRKLAELADVPFTAAMRLDKPVIPSNPHRPDPATLQKILPLALRVS